MADLTVDPDALLARDGYIATTAADLAVTSKAAFAKAMINQKVLFPRRGTASLYGNRLVLGDWDSTGDVSIYPSQILDISHEFTELYGRFIGGGVRRFGAPVVLRLKNEVEVYLLLNYRWFVERSDNVRWYGMLAQWMRTAHNAGLAG
ncbi:hypothetical protein BC739_006113 [Kutzneria viridogrisea]|nr:hypothetical protein [Kutzneria albida]MBA8928896.1 hypothetical protein [Kutzneria viridogrisea]